MKINEQQLENVARAIYEDTPDTHFVDLGNGNVGDEITQWQHVEVLRKAEFYRKAKAAIEAAFKLLPIEDAPKKGLDIIIGDERFADCTLEPEGWYSWSSDCHVKDMIDGEPEFFIAFPQED